MPSFYGDNPPDTEVGTTDATESQISEDAVTETDTSGGFYQGSPTQTTTEAYEADARTARDAAQAAQEAAEAAQEAAEASESSASASEANAASSQSAAATSATNASNSASAAAGSASTAATQASNAAGSATAAAGSASAAAASQSAAASSASAAASSASAAAASEAAAASSETNAAASEAAAASSETNAASSASAALASQSAAATSAGQAASSASDAAASESAAAASAANAAASETAADGSASSAAGSASAAASSASSASTSASAAASSETAAEAARDAAQAVYDNFDDRYLGAKAADPTLDNDGNALVTGALYFDTVNTVMKVYDGSAWLAAYASLSGALLNINNLDDVTDPATARLNLGLGTAAEQNVSAFATAAQGALADSALQAGDNVSVLVNDADYATVAQVDAAVAGLVDAAPATLDTLNELAAALGDDPNFATTVSNQIGLKQDAATALTTSTTFGGDVSGTYNAIVVADDSHNHVISNVDGLQAALDGKLATTANAVSASKWATARTITLGGVLSGSVSLDGSANVTLSAAHTSDPTLTLTGDVTGSATFTNLGNATLTATVANDSHTHDGRYYTESEADSRFFNVSGDTITGVITSTGGSTSRGVIETDDTDQWWIKLSAYDVGLYWNTTNNHINIRNTYGDLQYNANKVWHAGNDGSGSQLDADLLDGYQLSGATSVATKIFNNKGQNHSTYTDFNTVMTPGPNYLQQGTNGPTGTSSQQYYGFMFGLGNEYGTSTGSATNYASQMYYPRAAQGGDPYLYFRDMESGSWGSWRKVYAGYADNANLLDGLNSTQFLRSDTQATTSAPLTISANWGNGTYSDAFTVYGTYPSISLRSTNANGGTGQTFLMHTDSSGTIQYYFDTSGPNESWTKRHEVFPDGRFYATASVRSPIFYDIDDTAFYVDPASTSRIRKTNLVASGSGWDDGLNLYSADQSNRWNVLVDNGAGDPFRIAFNASERFNIATNGEAYFIGGLRSTIYYDRDNTGYYTDPASTSRTNHILSNSLEVATTYRGNFGGIGESWNGSSAYPTLYGSHVDRWVMHINPHIVWAQNGQRGFTGTTVGSMIRFEGNLAGSTTWDAGCLTSISAGGDHFGLTRSGSWRFYVDPSANAFAAGSMRAPIFYDSNNTGYYVNPNGDSQFTRVYADDWFRAQGSAGVYFQDYGYGLRSAHGEGNSYGNATTYGTGRNGWTGWGIGSRLCFMSDLPGAGGSGSTTGLHDNTYGWIWRWINESYFTVDRGYSTFANSARSPIFYDANNTGYYVNPDSTTAIRTHGSWRADSASWDGEFSGKLQYHINSWYFQFNSAIYFRNSGGSNVLTCDSSGNITASGNVTAYSDRRLKENIKPLSRARDYLKSIEAKTFVWREDGREDIGFIAQDVEEAGLHHFVVEQDSYDPNTEEHGDSVKALDYGRMVSVLWQAVKEQQTQIEAMAAEIKSLKEMKQ